jgi:aminopeptidase-like protein
LFQPSAFGTFPQHHISTDVLQLIRAEHPAFSFRILMDVIDIVEGDWAPLNLFLKGEPQCGRRGSYAALGGETTTG